TSQKLNDVANSRSDRLLGVVIFLWACIEKVLSVLEKKGSDIADTIFYYIVPKNKKQNLEKNTRERQRMQVCLPS
ncbi:MAG: hypothetical protein J0652_00005, partial [Desulfobulbaceae bacterium]|nr:hypothetical protein [Desulfobulbaceae bacterium]